MTNGSPGQWHLTSYGVGTWSRPSDRVPEDPAPVYDTKSQYRFFK
jgi:hypothetical protein